MTLIEIKVPVLGESVNEATVAKWRKKVGDAVVVDEVLVELETDKVTLGTILGVIDANAVASIVATPSVASSTPEKTVVTPIIVSTVEKSEPITMVKNMQLVPDVITHLSPAVRKHLGDNQLNAANVKASSLDGRLSKADVLNHVQNTGNTSAAVDSSLSFSDDRLEVRVPLSRLRLRVAERLKYAQNTAAILTTFNEIDMMAVKQLRDRYKDVFEKKYGVKLGFMSFFVKACTQALKEIPMVNSRIEGDEIVTNNYCDIGVAVSAPTGLVVPVVRDAELLDLAGIERAVAEYGRRAKDGKLTMEEMSGGTFTISNGGVFGSLFSTPIINPPQSAILGMHKIQDRPMAVNGRVEIRPMMYVALSYDHRLIDGREAVTFLATIKDCIENPGRFLLEL